jgi:hypothetical protein
LITSLLLFFSENILARSAISLVRLGLSLVIVAFKRKANSSKAYNLAGANHKDLKIRLPLWKVMLLHARVEVAKAGVVPGRKAVRNACKEPTLEQMA